MDAEAGASNGAEENDEDEVEKIPPAELVYIVALGSYVGKNKSGFYDIHTLMTKDPARNYLSKRGYSAKAVDKYINAMLYTKVMRLYAAPGQGQICTDDQGEPCLNSYTQPSLKPVEGTWTTISDVLDNLTVGDRKGREWLLNWMAAKVQSPTVPLPTALALLGASGTGKSTLVRVMIEMLGGRNCVIIGQNLLESSFTSSWAGKCLVNIDEAVSSEHALGVGYKVKRIITSEDVEYHAKGKDPIQIKNCGAWVFTSNSMLAIREDEDDRRITSFVQPTKPQPEYTEHLKRCFDFTRPTPEFEREIEAFFYYLLKYPVDRRLLTAPLVNEAKKEIATLSRNSAEDFLADLTEHGLAMLEEELKPQNKYDDPVELPKEPPYTKQDRTYRAVAKVGLYQLYTRFAKQNGQKAVTKNRFFALAQQKYGITEAARKDNKRYVTVWWAAEAPPSMQMAKGVQ